MYFLKAMSSFIFNDVPHKPRTLVHCSGSLDFSKELVEVDVILTEFWSKVLSKN